jgi:hypothetical protein
VAIGQRESASQQGEPDLHHAEFALWPWLSKDIGKTFAPLIGRSDPSITGSSNKRKSEIRDLEYRVPRKSATRKRVPRPKIRSKEIQNKSETRDVQSLDRKLASGWHCQQLASFAIKASLALGVIVLTFLGLRPRLNEHAVS